MRTQDVKVWGCYLCDGKKVIVVKRLKGKETTKRNMQSGAVFTGMARTKKRFLLDTGKFVFADKLTPIILGDE